MSTYTLSDDHVRTYHDTVAALRAKRDACRAQLPDSWNWELLSLSMACEGLLYGLTSLRLSFAAEYLLYSWPDLDDLIVQVRDYCLTEYGGLAIGHPPSALNAIARTYVRTLWALIGHVVPT